MDHVHLRRSFNRSAGLGGALAALPPLEIVQPGETDWVELWLQFTEADDRHAEAYFACDQAKFTARREHPEQRIPMWSVSVGWPGKVVTAGGMPVGWFGETMPTGELTREAIENHYDQAIASDMVDGDPRLVAEGKEYRLKTLTAFEKWEQACASVHAHHGVPALEVAEQEARESLNAAEARIINTPATDVKGIAVKLALWRRYADEEAHECSRELFSAWRDALRLAGLTEQLVPKGEDEA
jgi:hypothetical protein